MNWVLPAIATGIATATATTFDDNIYLSMFFSRVNRSFRPRHIVVGEFVGFTVLVGISLLGLITTRMLPTAWIGLLGLLPVGLGVHQLLNQHPASELNFCAMASPRDRGVPRQPHQSLWHTLRDPQTYQVSGVTVANGGNNIAIYIPLFASTTLPKLGVILLVCYAAIATWCLASYALIREPRGAVLMARYVRKAVPFVLIWLGCSILMRSGTPQTLLGLIAGAG